MFKKIYIGILISILFTGVVFADNIPLLINYRGKATSSGSPINGPTSVQFKIFNTKTGGILLWDSSGEIVNAVNGVFNYTLGTNTGNPLSPSIFTNEFLYLEITLAGELLSPRERIVSVGYAINADMVDGKNASAFAPNIHNHDTLYVSKNGDKMTGVLTNENGIIIGSGAPGLAITREGITNLENGNIIKLKNSASFKNDIEFHISDNMNDSFVWYDDSFGEMPVMRLYYNNGPMKWVLNMVSGGYMYANHIMCSNLQVSGSFIANAIMTSNIICNGDFMINTTMAPMSSGSHAYIIPTQGNGAGFYWNADMTGLMNLDDQGNLTIGGALNVNGNITKNGWTCNFTIDHPLDPENKILKHASVESPKVLNVYTGRAKLKNGQVLVKLPDYFDALNNEKNSRISLTPINGWSPLYLDGEIKNSQFKVKTTKNGNPKQEFDWIIYTERDDPFIRKHPYIAEQEKGKGNKFKKGEYISPKIYEKK